MAIIIKPKNVALITGALVQLLKDVLPNVRVERADELNETPGHCPWVGVYRENVEYVVKTLGYSQGFRDQVITLVAVVQEADGVSGEKCEDRLEQLLVGVCGAILSDEATLRGTVQVVRDLSVRYADYKKVGASYMQTAAV